MTQAISTEEKIAALLIKNGKTLSTAESCTGGLVSSLLTDVSGSSEYTKVNFVTYSNEAKIKYLSVKQQTLEKYGAVSQETAKEMAEGLIKNGADFGLATTGIAGPTGGSDLKPVGLVYIGIASKKESLAFKFNTKPDSERKVIKYEFAKKALEHLLAYIKEEILK